MCPQSYDSCGARKGFMDIHLFEKIIDNISSNDITKKGIVGFHVTGEPLLHKDILHFIKYTTDKGMYIRLNTNATKLDKNMSVGLIESGLQEIVFSFEGYSKEDYERIRVGANYNEVYNNILNFLQINESRGHPVKTEMFVVKIPEISEEKVSNFTKHMSSRFDTFNLVRCMDWAGQIEPYKNEYPIRISYKKFCTAFDTDLNILYDGRVVPCCFDSSGRMSFGDFNTQTLNEILNSKKRKCIIKNIKNENFEGLLCKDCSSILSRSTILINNLIVPRRVYKNARYLLHSFKRRFNK
jgi:radical SAM protein with 4Fe4S-binding SPASM domain